MKKVILILSLLLSSSYLLFSQQTVAITIVNNPGAYSCDEQVRITISAYNSSSNVAWGYVSGRGFDVISSGNSKTYYLNVPAGYVLDFNTFKMYVKENGLTCTHLFTVNPQSPNSSVNSGNCYQTNCSYYDGNVTVMTPDPNNNYVNGSQFTFYLRSDIITVGP